VAKTFKKYQGEHEKKFPAKADLRDRWEKYENEQKARMKEQQAAAKEANKIKEEEVKEEGKKPVEEESKDVQPVQEVQKQGPTQAEVDALADSYLSKKPVDPSVSEISTYNGAKTAKYNWSQGIKNVDLQMKLPEGVTKAK